MEFEKRLQRAIDRGERTRDAKGRRQVEQTMSEDEYKQLHTQCRLQLSEAVERFLNPLVDHFPGFRFVTIVGAEGWGAKISRDDLIVSPGRQPKSVYSRLEMVIRPYSPAHLVELAAKGTIRNKELFNRTHYQMLSAVDLDAFSEVIDLWVLEYAEQFAAQA